jgi:hypothetical protein
MNAPDIEALDRSLKLKQFIRCASCSHQVRLLQTILLNNAGYENVLNQEYFNILNDDPIISRSQDTINRLTDNNRERVFGGLDAANASTLVIDLTSSINIENYLKRKGKTFVYFNYRPLKDLGISNLNELLLEHEITQNYDTRIRIENTLSQFDRNLVEIAENYNEDFNNNNTPELYFLDSESILKNISSLSVKELQKVMKTILSKIESLNVTNKNNLQDFNFDMNNIRKFRKQCKEVKQRNVFYRLLNKDFFTAEQMYRYKMNTSPLCMRCGEIENNAHLLYNCRFSLQMWLSFNKIIKESLSSNYKIERFEDIYNFDSGPVENVLKIKLINELIQIDKPKHLNKNKILSIMNDIKNTERYIAIKNNQSLIAFNKKWKC